MINVNALAHAHANANDAHAPSVLGPINETRQHTLAEKKSRRAATCSLSLCHDSRTQFRPVRHNNNNTISL